LAFAYITDVLELEICRVGFDVNDVAQVGIRYGGALTVAATDGLDVGQRRVLARVGVYGDTGCGTTSGRA